MSSFHEKNPSADDVRQFYDSQTIRKLHDFTEGNARVEAGWKTFAEWLPARCRSILEVGCGIGTIAGRAALAYPRMRVLGLDISPKSVAIAKSLFRKRNLEFREQLLLPGNLQERFDYILMMDVYEHIAPTARPELHAAIREVLSEAGRVVLTFPASRKLSWQRIHEPEEIQPIDEDITLKEVGKLAEDLECDVLSLKTMNIWQQGDYYHLVLGRIVFPTPLPPEKRGKSFLKSVFHVLRTRIARKKQRRLVRDRLRQADPVKSLSRKNRNPSSANRN